MKLKLAIIFILFLIVSFTERHYTLPCTVYDRTTETTIVEDPTGNLWEFYGNVNKNKVRVVFDNNNTDSDRSDDKIVVIF